MLLHIVTFCSKSNTYAFPPSTICILKTSWAWSSWECLKGAKKPLHHCGFPSAISPLPSCAQPSGSSASTGGEPDIGERGKGEVGGEREGQELGCSVSPVSPDIVALLGRLHR